MQSSNESYLKIVIPGCPLSKARARTFTRKGKSFTYDPQYEEKKITQFRIKTQSDKELYSVIPDSHYKLHFRFFFKPDANLNTWIFPPCTINKDIDNLEKFYMDCMNKIVYPDDRFVTKSSTEKNYDLLPRTEIHITQMTYEPLDKKIDKILQVYDSETTYLLCDQVKELMHHISNFDNASDAQIWAKTTAQLILNIAKNHSEKLNKIEKLWNSPTKKSK